MNDGWIINYTDGTSIIYSRKKYHELKIENHEIESYQHWFDIKQAIEKHPWLEVIE